MQAIQTFQNKPTDHLRNWGFPIRVILYYYSCKQSECGRHSLSNILKLQAMFLYLIYYQRAGKNNLLHMRGGRFHAGNTLCIFKILQLLIDCVPFKVIMHCHFPPEFSAVTLGNLCSRYLQRFYNRGAH